MTPLTSPTLCSGLKAKLVIRNKIHHRSGSCAPSSKLISTRKLVPGTMHVPGVQQLRVLTSTRYYCCTYSPEEVLVAAAVLEKIPETGSPRVVLVFRAPVQHKESSFCLLTDARYIAQTLDSTVHQTARVSRSLEDGSKRRRGRHYPRICTLYRTPNNSSMQYVCSHHLPSLRL